MIKKKHFVNKKHIFNYLYYNSNKSDDRKDSPPVTEALKLNASPIKRMTKDLDSEKSKRPKNKSEVPK